MSTAAHNSKQSYAAARSVSVASGKGGTGKSIITASIGALLAKCGFKTLLVDTDVFTAGLSFYLLGQNPRRVSVGLQDVFIKGASYKDLNPVLISNEYTSGRLFLLPAVSRTKVESSELRIMPSFNMERLYQTLHDIKNMALEDLGFDFILFDTRGGTDLTSITTCVAAGAFIIVTEADKTSWDLGEILIDSISNTSTELQKDCLPLGYILNKNVLPSEAIEAFLRRRWGLAHLTTLPLDEEAIRAFQTDEIPVISAPSSRFSAGLLPVIRKAFLDSSWIEAEIEQLSLLEKNVESSTVGSSVEKSNRLSSRQRRLLVLKLYTIIISVAVFALALIFYNSSFSDIWLLALIGLSSFLVIITAFTDADFALSLVKTFTPIPEVPVQTADINSTRADSEHRSEFRFDVYLSYSSADRKFVEYVLIPALREWNVSFFYDKEALLPGQDIERELARALSNSKSVFAVLSKAYFSNPSTTRELERALLKDEGIIPIVIERSILNELPPQLSNRIVVPMISSREYEEGLRKIKRALVNSGIGSFTT
jgi:MinD-like ATPase involved in chromosome partitioning or flagellar assembly